MPPSVISNSTNKAKYLDYQSAGFSILAHEWEDMKDDTLTNAEALDIFKSTKQKLLNAGFIVSGWVTPSSTLNDKYKPLVKTVYDYSYTVYYGHYEADYEKRPYNLKSDGANELYRIDLYNNYADITLAVDRAINNNGFLTFYYHSSDLTDSDYNKILRVLAYIQGKVNEDKCTVLSPNLAYEYFWK